MFHGTSSLMRVAVGATVGYLICDTAVCASHSELREIATFAHHGTILQSSRARVVGHCGCCTGIVGVGFVIGLVNQFCTPYHVLFLLNEASTPFVNAHYFLRGCDRQIRILNGIMMWLTFFLFRICVNSAILLSIYHTTTWHLLSKHSVHWPVQFTLCIAAQVLNMTWFFLLSRGLLRHLLPARAVPSSSTGVADTPEKLLSAPQQKKMS